jgi:branched-subunit amino acid transport protein AzlD
MTASLTQQLILIAVMALGTAITRFTPFVVFPQNRPVPSVVRYLGQVLPYAVMGLLVVYCLKDVSVTTTPYGLPELIAVVSVVALYAWKRNILLSVGGGTVLYMVLVQVVFAGA